MHVPKKIPRSEVLKFYNRFFKDEITLTEISKKLQTRVSTIYKILMEENKIRNNKSDFSRKKQEEQLTEAFNVVKFNVEEAYYKTNKSIDEENNIEIIKPKEIIELGNNKVKVIYPSRINN